MVRAEDEESGSDSRERKFNLNIHIKQNVLRDMFVHYLRWSLRSIWVFLLFPSFCTFRRDIVFHLPVIADLVGFGHFLKFALLLRGHGLKNMRL